MGVNQSSTIGRIRLTPPIANTLERLLEDGSRAKELALKLEDELVEPEADKDGAGGGGEPKDGAGEDGNGASGERGSDAVQTSIERVLEGLGLEDDETLDESSRIRKVSWSRASSHHNTGSTVIDNSSRPKSLLING